MQSIFTKYNIINLLLVLLLFYLNIMYKRIFIVVSVFILLISCGLFASEEINNKKKEITPAQLYEVVRLLIKQAYLDKTFNNQDWDIWTYENRYKDQLNTFDDSTKAIQTMLASLGDRYTRYLDKKEYGEEVDAINAKLQGIGIQIGLDKEKKVVVIAPIQGTPAFKAGFLPKDIIDEVDGKSTNGLSVEEVANMIRGLPDTTVKIKILREGKELTHEVKRAEIKIDAIPADHYKKLTDEICYIHLTSFISQKASEELVNKLKELGECPSLIFDLRNNPGGLLYNAIEMSSIFLEDGMDIVSTVDRDGYVDTQTTVKKPLMKYNGEMVILVNSGSASASEILSGALKDNGRAVLVGDTTFGKGLVQIVRTLPDGSGVNITAAKYLTPNGSDIHEIGIKPHHKVKLSADDFEENKGPWFFNRENIYEKNIDTDKDVQLAKAMSILEKKVQVQE